MYKRVYKIPVGNMTREEAQKIIAEFMKQLNFTKFMRKERKEKYKKLFN